MPEPFVHLHLHSHYSLLDSLIRADELVHQVASLEMSAVALTDHGNLFGAHEFYSAARKAGVRGILGCEAYVAPGSRTEKSPGPGGRKPYNHLVLLAENETGWYNLTRLVTSAYLEGFYHRPRIDKELLAAHSEGLIGLSACASGEVAARLLAGDAQGAERAACEFREILGAGTTSSSRCRTTACARSRSCARACSRCRRAPASQRWPPTTATFTAARTSRRTGC